MKRRILALFLAAALCVGLIASPAAANGEKLQLKDQSASVRLPNSERISRESIDGASIGMESNASQATYQTGYKYDKDNNRTKIDENDTLYVIVELKTAPLGQLAAQLSGGNTMTQSAVRARENILTAEQASVMSSLNKVNGDAEMLFSYTAVLNGFATEIRYRDIKMLTSDSRVKNVYYSREYDLPEPNDASSVDMVYANGAWSLGFRGDGMLVAIVDTGVDYGHELLSTLDSEKKITQAEMQARVEAAGELNATTGSYYKNDKVIFGYDYADIDEDPMDTNSHGTHVAGIAAANVDDEGVIMGVAPNAQIMAMKVFPDAGGGAYDHWVIAAVDDAVKLGADSINLSLGFGGGFSTYEGLGEYGYNECFGNAREFGAVVNCSAGNESYMGQGDWIGVGLPYTSNPEYGVVGAPGTSTNAIAVASVDNTSYYLQYFLAGDIKSPFTDTNSPDFTTTFDGQSIPFVAVPGVGAPTDYEGLDVTGKIALVRRGELSFVDKVNNAHAKGAVAVVVYNNQAGSVNMDLTGANLPAIFVEQSYGDQLAAMGGGTMQFSSEFLGFFDSTTGSELSDFSSYGVTPDLKIKPEITAPGGGIYSTVPGGYGSKGGTSMAAPHVAGGAILVMQRVQEDFPDLTPAEQTALVENLMLSTALPITDPYGDFYPVQGQGSGMMDLEGAVKSPVIAYNADGESKVELGDKLDESAFSVQFTLENFSDEALTYQITNELLVDYFDSPGAGFNDYYLMLAVAMGESTNYDVTGNGQLWNEGNDYFVDIQAGGKLSIKVTFAMDADTHDYLLETSPNGYFVDGFVFFRPVGDGIDSFHTVSIPFLGFIGDWLDAPAFDKGSIYETYSSYADVPFYWNNLGLGEMWFLGFIQYFDVAGVNSWWPGDDNVAPADHVAFSPNGDTYFDAFSAQVDFLRNLKNIWVEIRDEDGNVVKTINTEESYFYKSFYHGNTGEVLSHDLTEYSLLWDGTNEAGNVAPEGNYQFVLCGVQDYVGAEEKPHEWALDVALDVTGPEYSYNFFEENGSYYVTISATDNHYLALVAVGDGTTIFDGTALKDYKEYTGTYDVTELVEKYGSVEAAQSNMLIYTEDYAQNFSSEYVIPRATPTAFAVTPANYVSGLAANLRVTLEGTDLHRSEFTAFVTSMWDPESEILTLKEGTHLYHIPAMPVVAQTTEFYFDLYQDGEYLASETILVHPLPENVWTPNLSTTEGDPDLYAIFGSEVLIMNGGVLTMGTTKYTYNTADDPAGRKFDYNDSIITIKGEADFSGNISISKVKYPILFPSYSFTFRFTA